MKKLLRLSILIFLTTVAVHSSNALNIRADSLQNLLNAHLVEDTVRVNLLNKNAAIYVDDANKRREYATQAGELADKLKFPKGKAESLWIIGLSYAKSDKPMAIDYFQKAVKTAKEINYKTGIVKYLTSLGNNYKAQNRDSLAIASFKEAVKISEEQNDQIEMAKSLINLAIAYRKIDNYEASIVEYQKALKIAEEHTDEVMEGTCLNGLGIIFAYRGNYPQALEYFQKNLKIKEKLNDPITTFTGVNNIGNIYMLLSDYPKAFDYYGRAMKIAEELKDQRKISSGYANIGSVYKKMNDMKCLEYFRKALEISEKINDEEITLTVLIYLGDVYIKQNDFERALESYQKALKLSEATGGKRPASEIAYKIGTIYMKQKKYGFALASTLKGLALADELKLMDSQNDIHKQLSEIYAAIYDYENAYIHHKLYTEINDSVHNQKNVKKIAELEFTYELEKEKQSMTLEQQKKDALQAAEKKQQRIIIFSLIIGFILMSLLAIFLIRSYWFKHKTNLLLTKQKREIEDLNEEYHTINEELTVSNEQLVITKELVEERENLLIQITDNVPVFISLINNDLEYKFANNGYARIFNRQKTEIQGRNVKEILSCDSYERALPNIVRTLEGNTVVYENSLVREDGEQRILQTTYIPYLQHHDIKGLIVCSDDITERKKAEQALREIEAEKAQLQAMEIERINSELDSNQKSVTAATLKLLQNSERDAQTIERLTGIEENTNPAGKQMISSLISDYKRISYNSNWDEFEILFEKVHKSFYEKLNIQFPTLTANDRKICAFLKLNMSNKDIAQITFQSDEALKKARLRLRQKFDLSREINLVAFLQNI